MVIQPQISATIASGPAIDHEPVEPLRARQALEAQEHERVEDADDGQQRADADHRLEGEAHDVDRAGPVVGRDGVQALDGRVGVVVGQDREHVGDLDPALDRLGRLVVPAEEVERGALRRLRQALEGGQLDRLVGGHRAARPVADHDLDRRGQAGDRQRHDHPGADVLGAVAAQPGHRVDAGHGEPDDHVAGEVHVGELVPEEAVEQRRPRVDVRDRAVDDVEADGVIHPAVDGQHGERAGQAGDDDRQADQEVRA